MDWGARRHESATWKNPNDLAILTTAKWYAKYERAGVYESSVCVAISQSTKQEFERWYSPPDDWKCETVLYGVDHLVFRPLNTDDEEEQLEHETLRKEYDAADEEALCGRPSHETPLLLAVGRLVARKGYRTLLRAMPSILERFPGARLCIIGRGHMGKTLLRQARKLGVGHAVFIRPGMSFEKLAQHFRSADLVVYPSYYEGQGLIPLESLASGTPVVTVDQPPLTEMIDSTVGELFETGNPEDLARAVCKSLGDPNGRTEQAERGRNRVLNHYTYEHNAEAYEKIYLDLIQA